MLNFIRKIRIDIQKHILIINKLASFSNCGKLKPHSVELKMCRVNEKNAYICINYSVINKFKQMCIMTTEELEKITDLIKERHRIEYFKLIHGDTHNELKEQLERSEFYNIAGVNFDSKKLLSIMPENNLDKELEAINEEIANFKTK